MCSCICISRPLRHGQYHHNHDSSTATYSTYVAVAATPSGEGGDEDDDGARIGREHSPKHASKELGQPHSFSVGVAMMHSLGPRFYTGPEITAVKSAHDSLLAS
jgi:hypothetical protein